MCMCLTRGGVGGEESEWMRGLVLGLTNPVGTGECWTCVCILVVGGDWVGGLDQGLECWGGFCLCEL